MNKVKSISISRTGLKADKYDVDDKTISIVIPQDEESADKIKRAYEERFKKEGLNIKHHKDIHYKKPFWKFWGIGDYSIAVYKIEMT